MRTAGVGESAPAQLGLRLDELGCRLDETLRVDGHGRRVGARRRRGGQEQQDAGYRRSADVPARSSSGSQSCEEPDGLSEKPYGYRMLGQVATLGRFKGIAELPGSTCGASRLVRDADLSPVAASALTGSSVSRRLDGRALLPPRHRRALDARTSAEAERLAQRLQRGLQRLLAGERAREQVAVTRNPIEHHVHRERERVEPRVSSSHRSGVDTGAPARGRTE